jgi:hypothetical protein
MNIHSRFFKVCDRVSLNNVHHDRDRDRDRVRDRVHEASQAGTDRVIVYHLITTKMDLSIKGQQIN